MKIPNQSRRCSFGGAVCAGAVLLMASSAPAQNLFVAGYATSTIYEIAPNGAETIFSTAVGDPADVAFDRAGDLFVADAHDSIFEFRNLNGTLSTTPVTFASELDDPTGLAFDSAGDLFVGCASAVVEYQSINGILSSRPTSFASGLDGAFSLVFDSAGDLFVSDYDGGSTARGYEFPSHNGTISSTPVPIQDLALTSGIAFDSAGDLFLSLPAVPPSSWAIFEVPNHNGTLNWNQSRTFASGSGLVTPYGLAFDTAGDLFAAAFSGDNVLEFVNNKGTLSSTPTVFASGLDGPWGLAFQPATSGCYPDPSGIVNWWPGNDNTSDIAGGDDAFWYPVAPDTVYVPGEVQDAFLFDGGHFLATPERFNNPQNFSEECWFNTTNTDGGVLVGFAQDQTDLDGQYDRFIFMLDDGTLHFGIWTGGAVTADSPDSYNDGNWHHVAATQSTAGGIVLYVDGAPVASNPNGTTPQNYNGYWRIGQDKMDNWPDVPDNYYFTGAIDEVTIYDAVLTAAQVQGIYQAGSDGKCAPLPCNAGSLAISLVQPHSIKLTWSGGGILEQSTSPVGPWTPVQGATSPLVVPATATEMYYILVCP